MKQAKSHFSTGQLESDLKARTIQGATATFVGQGLKFLLQIGSIMVLARLLTPDDFGLVAMVTAVTGFILIFKDLGLSMATVQRAEIKHAQVSTLFWINLALSTILMLITLALAPAIAWFYDDARLAKMAAVLSVAFILGGLTVQHQALLRRQMHFRTITLIDVSAMALGILAAIVCAWVGLTYWSLVWMQIVTALATAIGVWVASGWIPSLPTRRSGVRSMLKFGGYLSAYSFVNYFARNADQILIGRFYGAGALGLYSRAFSILLFPIGQITAPMTAVAVPALSRLQDDPQRYRNYYLSAVKIIAYLSMPLVAFMGVVSEEIVYFVLGENWLESSTIFTALAFAAFWSPFASTTGWIFISRGETRRMLQCALVATPVRIIAFLIGIRWGVLGVAISYSITITLQIIPQFWFALKNSPLSVWSVLAVVSKPFFLSLIVAGASFYVHMRIAGNGYLESLAGTAFTAAISLIVLVLLVRPLRDDIVMLAAKAGLPLVRS